MKILKPLVALLVSMLIFGLTADSAFAQKGHGKKIVKRKAKTKNTNGEKLVYADSGSSERKSPGSTGSAGSSSGKTATLNVIRKDEKIDLGKPTIRKLEKAGSFDGDLRQLPKRKPRKYDRPEREGPDFDPILIGPPLEETFQPFAPDVVPAAPAPSASVQFNGLDFNTWGAGFPPDTNGDVGPNHYIQTINTSIGIYSKTGTQLAAFTFDTFMSQATFGNLCDGDNFGDPVVLYDTFEDRWVITDFAFQNGGSGVVNPPGAFECIAVSKTGDPVAGGWNFYSLQFADGLNDYPKLGVWPDGIYMTLNMFGFGSISGSFLYTRQFAFNKAQMYAGDPNPQIVTFDAPRLDQNGGTVFTIIPSNARLQSGSPPAGTPNYFVGTGTYTNALAIWRFDVDWDNVLASTFTGVTTVGTGSTWLTAPASVPAQGGNALDTIANRSMVQNQYSNLSGAESLWLSHTVQGTGGASHSGVRWYQANVTGGTIAATTTQTSTHSPENTVNRFVPSLAVDRAGDMMIGYSASNSAMKPAVRYAGRLFGDPVNTLPQTEVDLIQGTGAQQVGISRWGDYSAMTLDPNGCTFWYTSEYYIADGSNYQTRIGAFGFPSCTNVGNGTVSGTVTTSPAGTPISGATVTFGSRTTTTAVNGTYSFANIPAGTYSGISVSSGGRNSAATAAVVVPDGGTSTNDFALTEAPVSACLTDTSQTDFSQGTPIKVDLTTTPGDATLSNRNLDQLNTSLGGSGVGLSTTAWGGQTFTPTVNGLLTRADIALFCSGCTGVPPALTLSVRATAANLPVGADLASTTIPGFLIGTSIFYSGTFAVPANLTAGTRYALIIRPNAAPVGTYALTRSGNAGTGQDVYPNGDRVSSANSGGTWAINTTGGVVTDAGFRTFMTTDSGTFVSGLNDANPLTTVTPNWTTLSWTAATPPLTSLQFQAAGSNNPNGPFNFVGPDTTSGTFYTVSGGSLAQFNGLRYLKYKAYPASTDPLAASPSLNDVTVCFSNLAPTAAGVSIAGRVVNSGGMGIRRALVSLVAPDGTTRIAGTNTFGYFRFESVAAGQSYVATVSAARYRFDSQLVNVSENLLDLNFTAR